MIDDATRAVDSAVLNAENSTKSAVKLADTSTKSAVKLAETSTNTKQIVERIPIIPPNPKGYFANERTFLHWQSLTLILGSVGIGLLNFGNLDSQISGTIFVIIAMAFSVYSLVQFHKRQDLLARKYKGIEYQDISGLTAMIFVVLMAVLINFGLHFMYQ